jgi:hypothetical protein
MTPNVRRRIRRLLDKGDWPAAIDLAPQAGCTDPIIEAGAMSVQLPDWEADALAAVARLHELTEPRHARR